MPDPDASAWVIIGAVVGSLMTQAAFWVGVWWQGYHQKGK